MSTRANIIIRKDYHDEESLLLYRHCDGNPENLGQDIENALRNVTDADKVSSVAMRDFLLRKVPDVRIAEHEVGDPYCDYYIQWGIGMASWTGREYRDCGEICRF